LLDASVPVPPSDRKLGSDPWAEDTDETTKAPFKRLTRDEAQVLVANNPHAVSPWRVIAVQAAVGVVVALVAGLVTGRWDVVWSALYGAGVVVIPGALLARGMTSALTSVSPGASAIGFMFWEMVKIGVAVVLLVLANRIVQPLSWPALLVALVACIKVYWLALAWRRR
jgi:ATP synthase protein I